MGNRNSSENPKIGTFFGGPPIDYSHGDPTFGYIRRQSEVVVEETFVPPRRCEISIIPMPIEIDESSLQITNDINTSETQETPVSSLSCSFRFASLGIEYWLKNCEVRKLKLSDFGETFSEHFKIRLHTKCYLKENLDESRIILEKQKFVIMNKEVVNLLFPERIKSEGSCSENSGNIEFRTEHFEEFQFPFLSVDSNYDIIRGTESILDQLFLCEFCIGDCYQLRLEKVVKKFVNESSGKINVSSETRETGEISEEEEEDRDGDRAGLENGDDEKELLFRYMKYFPLLLEFQTPWVNILYFIQVYPNFETKVRIERRYIQIKKFDIMKLKEFKSSKTKKKKICEEEEEEINIKKKLLIGESTQNFGSSQDRDGREDEIEKEYECDEIFGILNTEKENICVICLERKSDTVLNPCRHCCCCNECSIVLTVEKKSKVCPICRSNIDSLFQIPPVE